MILCFICTVELQIYNRVSNHEINFWGCFYTRPILHHTAQCSDSLIGGVCKPQFQSLWRDFSQNLVVSSTGEWYNLGKIMERHLHRAGVHWSAQECTKCTFSPTFLFVKLESWNLVWMFEFEFHKLSYKPYFEKNRCAMVHSGALKCTGVHKVHIFPNCFVC